MAQKPGSLPLVARAALIVALAALTFFVFGEVGNHPFIGLDDTRDIAGNPGVRAGLTAGGVRWAFSIGHPPYWHPLTTLSHMLDVELFGLDAGRHLLVNAALHLATALLFCGFIGAATGCWRTAALAAALFVVHPLRVESVAWAAERKDVLSGLFWMATLLAFVRWARRPSRAGALGTAVLFALGLLAKPVVVVLPLVLLALDFWPLGRHRQGSWRRLAGEKLPLAAAAGAVAVITALVVRGTTFAERSFPWGERLSNAAVAPIAYLAQTAWPAGLAIFYPHPASVGGSTPLWEALGSTLALCGISVAAWRLRARRPWLLVGWVWYLATLAPTLGIVQNWEQARADRFTYLPLAGVFWALSQEAVAVARVSLGRRLAAGLAGVGMVAAFSLAARSQLGYWAEPARLFQHALDVTEKNWLASSQLGVILMRQGRDAEAEDLLRRALELRPLFPVAHNNLGVLLNRHGRTEDATREYETAVAQDRGYFEALVNLGNQRLRAGRGAEAAMLYGRAVAAQPQSAIARVNLGAALEASGEVEQARVQYETALRLDPGATFAADALRRLGGH